MSKFTNNLQDIFLNEARKTKMQVTLYLINGFQLKGNITGFDTFTVVLNCDEKQMMVYKHAISTITPLNPILLGSEEI
ncbi:RNA chaperone Hfq [Clostridium estertheticum]|uniref:RNA-binding protein Hfq n=1 Tax=Clostridium estertheticum subsp. estertheticum TaxID=1552 RepID=A0A1J0GHK8_9CLOT|nr:RNA chaperone Hfq [Clostridium estertheticum]APC40884.1 RNA chaperone Hfq [Clostridium estertheticum subsp. estertheticum]MBZ9617255.1 RNA chaperone Hfq [Clostridium estertheticum subsp. laramiense]WAG72944.1 RNA chaperone Hfq [Clostridium estertheticum]